MLLHKSVQHDSRVRREASALARAGHHVTVLELAPVPAGGSELEGFERRSVLPPASMRRGPLHLYRLAFLASFISAQVRLRPNVVHAHDAAMLLPGVIGARLTGASLVYDSHELATSVPYRERAWAWFVGAIERLVLPRCAAVITVSDGIALRLRLRYRLPRSPTVVRNVTALQPSEDEGTGDDAEPEEPRGPHTHRTTGSRRGMRARLGIDTRTPLVLHQGAPAPARGCEVLIAALALLPGAQLVFLGDPEPGYGEALRRVAHAHAVQDRVTLLPDRARRGAIGPHRRGRRRRHAPAGHLREPPPRAAQQAVRVHRRRRARRCERPARDPAAGGRARRRLVRPPDDPAAVAPRLAGRP